jgi:Acyltransferase
VPDLYDAVGHGMWAYSRAAFRVTTLSEGPFAPEPGTLVVTTHRRETDVPILCPPLYFGMGGRRNRTDRLHFAARDDMFLPGFFAGFPPELPARVRRLLYPVGVGRWLPLVNVFPIRSASVARLGEVLAARPGEPLADLVPAETLEAFRARGPVGRAGDALQGVYADLLWRVVSPGEGVTGNLDDFWSRRAAQAAGDFRHLVQLLRDGRVLVVFPEGRPSPDGEIGPVRPGVSALVRRGRPAAMRPLAIAYDPLVRGRTRVHLALGEPVEPPSGDIEAEILTTLRRAMPLTTGQFVASRLAAGAGADPTALERDLADAVALARSEGRPVEPELETPEGRHGRLGEALAVAPRRSGELPFLAREHASAREPR